MFGGAWSGGKIVGPGAAGNAGGHDDEDEVGDGFERDWIHEWDGTVDSKRGWVIAGAWAITACAEYVFLPFPRFFLLEKSSFVSKTRSFLPPKRAVFVSFHPPADPHLRPRRLLHVQPHHPNHLLFLPGAELDVLLAGDGDMYGGHDRVGRAGVCGSGDEGGYRGLERESG